MKRTIFLILFHLSLGMYSQEMETVLEKLLEKHPEIRSLNSELISKRGNANHDTTYPDPKIGVAFRNYPTRSYSLNDKEYDTPGMTGIEYSVSQEIPFPGKLTLQGKTSKLNEIEFSHFVKSRQNQFLFEYLSNLIRLKSAEKKVLFNELIQKTLESQKKISTSTYATGNSSLSQSLKLQVEGTLAKEKEIELNRDKEIAIASFYYFENNTDLSKEQILKVDTSHYLFRKKEFLFSQKDKLISRLAENPNYKLSTVALERSKQESKLASILHAPDTEVFFSYMKRRNRIYTVDDGPFNYQIMDNTEYRGDLFSFGVNVRVPVWSFFSKHEIDTRSEENVKSKNFELERNKIFLESSLKKLQVTMESLENQLNLIQKQLIPELEKTQLALTSQFGAGKINLSEVLNTKLDIYKAHISAEEIEEKRAITLLMILDLTDYLYIKDK